MFLTSCTMLSSQGTASTEIVEDHKITSSSQAASSTHLQPTTTPEVTSDEVINQIRQISEPISGGSIFGIHLHNLTDEDLLLAKNLGSRWIREDLKWYLIEPNEGDRDWDAIAGLEQELSNSAQRGMESIVIIGGTPKWALKEGYICGAIAQDKLDTFGKFVGDVVKRYSIEPYNIKYWELYNEPDTAGVLGCWGDKNDEFYGGAYYSEMLKMVYKSIKDADPNANVLVGGLLLDCDPRPESNWCEFWGHDDRPPKFLEGILMNNGGEFFDGISFHGYDYFDYTDPQLGEYLNPLWGNSWNGSFVDGGYVDRIGPVIGYKAKYINELLEKYNVDGKYLLNSENALICGDAADPSGGAGCESNEVSLFEQTKARYVTQAYTSAYANGLVVNIWFSLYGWRNSGLLSEDQDIKPAYTAYKITYTELGDIEFYREVFDYPNVHIYEFQRADAIVWVIWSSDGNPHDIILPSSPDEVKDFLGGIKDPNSPFTATLDPHYIIWKP